MAAFSYWKWGKRRLFLNIGKTCWWHRQDPEGPVILYLLDTIFSEITWPLETRFSSRTWLTLRRLQPGLWVWGQSGIISRPRQYLSPVEWQNHGILMFLSFYRCKKFPDSIHIRPLQFSVMRVEGLNNDDHPGSGNHPVIISGSIRWSLIEPATGKPSGSWILFRSSPRSYDFRVPVMENSFGPTSTHKFHEPVCWWIPQDSRHGILAVNTVSIETICCILILRRIICSFRFVSIYHPPDLRRINLIKSCHYDQKPGWWSVLRTKLIAKDFKENMGKQKMVSAFLFLHPVSPQR